MSTNRTRTALVLACLLAAVPLLAAGADEAPSKETAPADAGKMGHSPASKEHRMMDRNAPTGPATEAAAPDNGMGHSPASKEHRMMKPKSHHKHAAPDTSTSSKPNMMGHSPASKEHTMMKHEPAAKDAEKKDDGAKPTP